MPGLGVALLAEARLCQLQHRLVVRPVGIVAVGATLDHGLMAPQEGAPLLRVAGEARVVQRRFLEQGRGDRAVRIVARRARHLAFAERHVGAPHRLGPLLDVAAAARFDLGGLGELMLGRDVLHHLVTVGAGHVARLVRAPLPEDPGAFGVAVEADLIPLLHRGAIILREGDEAALALASPGLYMGLPGTVAALAGVAFLWIAGLVQEEASHASLGERPEGLLVAALAGLRPDVATGRARGPRGRRRHGRRRGRGRRLLRARGEGHPEHDPATESDRRAVENHGASSRLWAQAGASRRALRRPPRGSASPAARPAPRRRAGSVRPRTGAGPGT